MLGFWGNDGINAFDTIYTGLYGIQHRGQQSAGIAVITDNKIEYHKGLGLVSEVFADSLKYRVKDAKAGVGHVGYNALEQNVLENTQPFVVRYKKGQFALSYSGSLLNGAELRSELEDEGYIFQSASDAETIAALISKERVKTHTIEASLKKVMGSRLIGAYSMIIMSPHKMVAVRDPKGMKPLCIGKLGDSFVFASESTALDTIGAKFLRDVYPGEIVTVDDSGMKSRFFSREKIETAMCIFEFVYLARTDSYIDGVNVYHSRYEAGRILAEECPADADIVIGVPDSGITAALGFSSRSGIPYAEGLMKNRYIGRTFIQPVQGNRETAVGLKLNPIRSQVEGKRVVLIDDSIVRGTTSKKIVTLLKEVGKAKEVHMRISSPPVKFGCHYGVDTANSESLIANKMNFKEICELIGADSLGFISIEGLKRTPLGAKCKFCMACFNGEYPI